MTERNRNVLIVVAIAALVAFTTGGAIAASYVYAVLQIGMIAGLCYFGWVTWKQNRHQIRWMPKRQQQLFYVAVAALAVVLLTAFVLGFFRPWTAFTALAYLVVVGGLGFAIWRIWSDAQRYY